MGSCGWRELVLNIYFNIETFVAKIGAGQRLGNVALGIHAQGGRALPHGTCAGVGIGMLIVLK